MYAPGLTAAPAKEGTSGTARRGSNRHGLNGGCLFGSHRTEAALHWEHTNPPHSPDQELPQPAALAEQREDQHGGGDGVQLLGKEAIAGLSGRSHATGRSNCVLMLKSKLFKLIASLPLARVPASASHDVLSDLGPCYST